MVNLHRIRNAEVKNLALYFLIAIAVISCKTEIVQENVNSYISTNWQVKLFNDSTWAAYDGTNLKVDNDTLSGTRKFRTFFDLPKTFDELRFLEFDFGEIPQSFKNCCERL